jgi:hypothetical protein
LRYANFFLDNPQRSWHESTRDAPRHHQPTSDSRGGDRHPRDGGPLKPDEDPTAPLNKLVQTLRRTVALKKMIAEDLEKRRAGLVTERAARRQQRSEDHEASVNNEIDDALTDAFTVMYGDGDAETDEGDAFCREMLADKETLFVDSEVFNDYLTRPVGETVTLLCVALGLPADTCIRQGDTWLVKRPPGAYETFRETRAAEAGPPPATASPPRSSPHPSP